MCIGLQVGISIWLNGQEDKSGGNKFEWKSNDKRFWSKLKDKIKLFDPLKGRKQEHKTIWYTWCNIQQGRRRIDYKLDRFYIKKDMFSFSKYENGNSIKVLPYTLYDHHPIQAKIVHHDDL